MEFDDVNSTMDEVPESIQNKLNEVKELYSKETALITSNAKTVKSDFEEISLLLQRAQDFENNTDNSETKSQVVFDVYDEIPHKLQGMILAIEDLHYSIVEVGDIRFDLEDVISEYKELSKSSGDDPEVKKRFRPVSYTHLTLPTNREV